MFTSYKKTVTNILEDKIFEEGLYCDLDFTANFFYSDHFLFNAQTWINSRQFEYYPDNATDLKTYASQSDDILDVYFQWLSFCYCKDAYQSQAANANTKINWYKNWAIDTKRCECGVLVSDIDLSN